MVDDSEKDKILQTLATEILRTHVDDNREEYQKILSKVILGHEVTASMSWDAINGCVIVKAKWEIE